jgi:N-acetylmuramic acid 6-phosphate etherase
VIVGLDAGQTGVRAVLDDGPLAQPGPEAPGVPRMEGRVGPDDVADALLAAVDGASLADVSAIGVGLSGFELADAGELERIAGRLRERVGGAPAVALASDGVTSLLGALGHRPGVVVAVGTGVVVLGHDGGDGWAKVDGWGSLLGDDGSGFAIGRAGLRAAMRAHDGRTGSELLRAAAEERWGPLDGLGTAIHRDAAPSGRVVASFTPAVAEAARAGDAVARAIWERAGDDLAQSAVAAAGRLFSRDSEVAVAAVGNVWNAGELIDEPFRRGLERRWPGAVVVEPAGTSLEGAVELARPDGPAPVPGLLWRG